MSENRIAYTVTCRIADDGKAQAWLTWLQGSHIADVMAAGAADAELVKLDSDDRPGAAYRIRYHFDSRAAYDDYVANHFPRLRQEVSKHFPPADDFRYSRSVGEVLFKA